MDSLRRVQTNRKASAEMLASLRQSPDPRRRDEELFSEDEEDVQLQGSEMS